MTTKNTRKGLWGTRVLGTLSALTLAAVASLAVLLANPVPSFADGGAACAQAPSTLEAWVFIPASLQVNFEDSGGWGAYALQFPASVASIDQSWGGFDNPAPLLWYVQHTPGSSTQIYLLFGPCMTYSPALTQAMQTNHFAPSEIGGVNPPGLTAPTNPPTSGSTGNGTSTSGAGGGTSTSGSTSGGTSSGSGTSTGGGTKVVPLPPPPKSLTPTPISPNGLVAPQAVVNPPQSAGTKWAAGIAQDQVCLTHPTDPKCAGNFVQPKKHVRPEPHKRITMLEILGMLVVLGGLGYLGWRVFRPKDATMSEH